MTQLQKVRTIWSELFFEEHAFKLWEAHLVWLHSLGFERALDQVSQTGELELTGHEVVSLLGRFVQATGYVNAHLGLTSSDIVDNVRLMQVRESCDQIEGALGLAIQKLDVVFNSRRETVGFTHWQPAAPITWSHRLNAWVGPLTALLAAPPVIYAKKFGGPVGDASSLALVVGEQKLHDNPFEWGDFHLEYPNNSHPLQSSDHTCETAAVNWCCAIAAQVHKIAQDLRFLASQGHVTIGREPRHVGSSSMPHKINPHKWEKICSICRSVSTTQQEMWSVAAHNSLERTLDTSWQIQRLLQRCFEGLALALCELREVDAFIDDNGSTTDLMLLRDQLTSDRDLARRVIAGENRWDAFREMIKRRR